MASMDVPADRPVAVPAAPAVVVKPTYITWLTLAFMTTASVASLRSAPTMAVYGLTCVFLYIVPAIIFLLPQSLVAAELASGWTGGVFRWVSEGISAKWGLLAVWCQFAMTIFYYPTLLGFVASTLAYVFNPDLATNGVYTGIVIVVVFWLGVFMSARGGTGGIAKLASSGLLIGTLIPGAVLVILGIVYLLQGNPSAAPMDADHLIPQWTGIASLVLIVNNFLSYSGMEMNSVHVGSLQEPEEGVPEGDVLRHGARAADLHPAGAGDQLGRAGPAAEPDRGRDAGVQRVLRLLRHRAAGPGRRDRARVRVGRRDADLARRPVEGPADDRAPRGLPAAVLPAPERERVPGQHPRRPGRRHDRDRAHVRADPVGVERLLDPERDDDAGLPDRLPADVRRRGQPAQTAAERGTRVHGAGAEVPVRRRLPRLGRRDPDRLRAAVAVRERQARPPTSG